MIRSLDDVTEFPLCWPESKPRAADRKRRSYRGSFFGRTNKPMTRARALAALEAELQRWKVTAWVVSMAPAYRAAKGLTDPGVALWWEHGPKRELRVLACDQYHEPQDNAYAIALTLDAMRGLERWGAYTIEQAVEGARPALPPPEGMRAIDWRAVLGDLPKGVDNDDAIAILDRRYRRAAGALDPADQTALQHLNLAIDAARKEFATG